MAVGRIFFSLCQGKKGERYPRKHLLLLAFRVIYRLPKRKEVWLVEIQIREGSREQKRKLKVCAYCRVSTDADEQENSLENQVRHYETVIKANPDYELAVIQIGEEKYTTSPVEIEVDKSLAIMAEFKPVSTPPGTDVAVTGVSLNITSKALAVGESFALQAKVTPNNATMKTVSWSSSDETVATVDADGVVTALKIGTCKITVATDDGNKTASCVVTVSGTVGIEQIINDHQIYCERGAITVHPARPISIRIIAVTGVSLYGDSIIGTTRIPVSTGIYLIEINENGKRITVKVNVR